MIIRDEKPADFAAVHELLAAAFQRPDEAVLVDHLRSDGECVISLVAIDDDEIVRHVLFSRMAAPFRALGLGPVSVKPDLQRTGIGSQLICTGLDRAREAGWQGLFVLSEPKYYSRFEFDPGLARGFMSRYSGPHLMAVALGIELPATEGVIEEVSSDIVDLFRGVGITDQETIIDTVHRKRKKLASRWQPHLNLGTLPLLTMKADGSTRLSNNTINL